METIEFNANNVVGYIKYVQKRDMVAIIEFSLESNLDEFHAESFIRGIFHEKRDIIISDDANIWTR